MRQFPQKIKIGIHPSIDVFSFNITKNRVVVPYDGFEFELSQIYGQFLGAEIEYLIPPDELTWGRRLPNDSWTGILGLAHRKEVDIIMGAIFMRLERDLIGHPTNPYKMEEIRFLTKLPDFQPKTLVFIEPFLFDVWIAIGISLIIASFVLFLIHKRKYSFFYQLFSMTALLLQQGAEVEPEMNFANRMPFASWTIVAQLLSLSYMSVLLSFMTVPKREPIIDTVEKLLTAVDKGKYKIATPFEMPLYLAWLENNENPVKKRLGKYVRDNNWIFNFNAKNTIDALVNKFALVYPSLGRRLFIRGRIIESKEIFHSGGLVLYTAKGFCCREALNLMIARTDASGIYLKLLDHFIFKQQIHLNESELERMPEEIKTLTLEDLGGCFLLFVLGIVTSGLFFLFELIRSSNTSERNAFSNFFTKAYNLFFSSRSEVELDDISFEAKADLLSHSPSDVKSALASEAKSAVKKSAANNINARIKAIDDVNEEKKR